MSKIRTLNALSIFDSRGNPTVKAWVTLDDGSVASSAVPSGASKGKYEAHELRDEDDNFNGLGVNKAVDNIKNKIAPVILGMDPTRIQDIDKKMIEADGSDDKHMIGANAMLAVSQAVTKAAAQSAGIPLYSFIRSLISNTTSEINLPTPLFNMIEGGQHADNGLDFQEFLVIPATQKSFTEQMKMGVNIYHELKKMLAEQNMSTLIADEGGFAPDLGANTDALLLLKSATERAKYQFALDAFLGMDLAANSFTDTKNYKLIDRNISYSSQELVAYYQNLASDFSLLYMEDPLSEDDLSAWKMLHETIGTNTMIVGDDLTVTNPLRFQLAVENNTIGGIIIKPNQIGTVSEAIAVSEMAHFAKIKVIVSHRSGETPDDFIADFAVGVGAEYAKFGAPAHERIIKYNRLLEISEEISLSKIQLA